MLSLETLLQAAEGGEKEIGIVHADFEEKGLDSWLRGAIERRLDPALGARVVPPRRSEEVLRALEASTRSGAGGSPRSTAASGASGWFCRRVGGGWPA